MVISPNRLIEIFETSVFNNFGYIKTENNQNKTRIKKETK
jgi:hypothetical protein